MKNRLIAFLLVVLTVFGALILPVTAAEDKNQDKAVKEALSNGDKYNDVESKVSKEIINGWTALYAQTEKYQLFCNKYTGEVYLRDLTTGQFLTTNPIKVGIVQQEDKLSQVWLSYKTFDASSTEVEYNSFKMAAERGQISVSPIRGGIRVEYLLGDTSSRSVAPQVILDSDFRNTLVDGLQIDARREDHHERALLARLLEGYDFEAARQVVRQAVVEDEIACEAVGELVCDVGGACVKILCGWGRRAVRRADGGDWPR